MVLKFGCYKKTIQLYETGIDLNHKRGGVTADDDGIERGNVDDIPGGAKGVECGAFGETDKPPRSIPREVLTRLAMEGFVSTADDDCIERGNVDDLPGGSKGVECGAIIGETPNDPFPGFAVPLPLGAEPFSRLLKGIKSLCPTH